MFRALWKPLRLPRHSSRTFATRKTSRVPPDSLHRSSPPQRRKLRNNENDFKRPGEQPARPGGHHPPSESSKNQAVSNALARIPDSQNSLATPVHIPEDPSAILKEKHPAMRLLDNSAIVVQRQLEMMNVLMGFEQANRYIIMDPHGGHIGYLAEQEHGLGNAVARQMFRTHRSFTTRVFDRQEKEVLRFHRPFSWVSSRIQVYDALSEESNRLQSSTALRGVSKGIEISQTNPNVSSLPLSSMRIIGSAEQQWAPLRRKYNLFLARSIDDKPASPDTPRIASGDLPLSSSKALRVAESDPREVGMLQFARVDEPFLSWDFSLMSEDRQLIGSVNRNFGGFARELFTDTGAYALRMDAAGLNSETSHLISQTAKHAKPVSRDYPGMTLDQRAVMLATAVSIDFDYFSRHSGAGGGLWPMWLPWWGGEAAGGAAAGEAGAVGAAGTAAGETGIASEAGAAARGLGVGEGAAAGAGTLAGYEAMQRAKENASDAQSPQATDPYQSGSDQGQQPGQGEEVWGAKDDPWGNNDANDFWGGGGNSGGGSSGGGGGSGASGGDGGGGFDIGDWF